MTLQDLQLRLDYQWSEREFLMQALRHSSWCNEQPSKPKSNERFEFLGDSVLDLLCAEFLMRKDPYAREGWLAQTRSSMVRESALAQRARDVGLGQFLIVGRGKDDIRMFDSVLADAMEAIVGAAYRDGGLEAARRVAVAAGILR